MKTIKHFVALLACTVLCIPAISQKYKTAADTVRLNKEYVELSNDIAELTSKLTIAQNNLPAYHTKATEAASTAEDAAMESSKQASKATNGSLSDAKSAKRKARKAYNEASDANSANEHIKDQDKKIAKLMSQLQYKKDKLADLEAMRTAIRAAQQ
jgi:DNA repair exonuclease SbcCD ATPase subunit